MRETAVDQLATIPSTEISVVDRIVTDVIDGYNVQIDDLMRAAFIVYIGVPILILTTTALLCVLASTIVSTDFVFEIIVTINSVLVIGSILCVLSAAHYMQIHELNMEITLQLMQYHHAYISMIRASGRMYLADTLLVNSVREIDETLADISAKVYTSWLARMLYFRIRLTYRIEKCS